MRIKMLETFVAYSKGQTYDLLEAEAKRVMNQGVAYNADPLPVSDGWKAKYAENPKAWVDCLQCIGDVVSPLVFDEVIRALKPLFQDNNRRVVNTGMSCQTINEGE